MAKKRKHESKSTEPSEPPQKHHHHQDEEPVVEEQTQFEEPKVEDEEVFEEEEEAEYEEEEEEEEEEEDEDEDDTEDQAPNDVNQPLTTTSGSGSGANQAVGDDEEDERIPKLLEPLSKEQLINLLDEAADKHGDVADRIRKVADEDPVHRKIFVHGLGWDTNAETLTNVFKQYGEIEDCKAVCDKISGKSKGYGFILFKTRSGTRKALKEPQKKIGNRMTACQLASMGPMAAPSTPAAPSSHPHHHQPQHHHHHQQQQQQQQQQQVSEYTQRKIYVSNVGADLDPQKLLSFFSKYGEVEEGPLGLDKMTGRPKGFCLFVYRKTESAKKALEEPHKNFEGHMLHCQKAVDGPKPSKSQHQHHHYNPQNAPFQRNDNPNFSVGIGGPAATTPGVAGIGGALNPALGQALTALIATQGAGLGLTNFLGAMNQGMPGVGHGIQGGGGGYGNQANISPGGMIGGYGNQGMPQQGVGYAANQQMMGQSGSGRGQHGLGQFGGAAPYMGH